MKIILPLIINALALWITTFIVPGISILDLKSLILAALVIGVLNTFLKPILQLLTLPVNFLTFGLFSWLISAFLLWIASRLVPGFEVQGFLSSLFGGIILAFVASLLQTLIKR